MISESNVSSVLPQGTLHSPSPLGVRMTEGSGGSQSASEPPKLQQIAQHWPGTLLMGMRSQRE